MAGLYGWFFDEVPPVVPLPEGLAGAPWKLLYVGIAPKPAPLNGARPSKRTIRHRVREHLKRNAEASTLRLTLGCLLADQLGLELRRVGSGNRLTFVHGEQVLNKWLDAHARVSYLAVESPREVEKAVIEREYLPLNLSDNRHNPFFEELTRIRKDAKAAARALPVLPNPSGRGTAKR
ncbi:GIY-YIG nuclease family protein [Actinokineospora cianjurensis]|uniref:GIY-YIG nuclease family protein n=1 Tax=Actinokineospora cianjurensis TaxID=585224 RepID=UPI00319DB271